MVIFFGEMSHFSGFRLHCAYVLPGVLMAPDIFIKQLFPREMELGGKECRKDMQACYSPRCGGNTEEQEAWVRHASSHAVVFTRKVSRMSLHWNDMFCGNTLAENVGSTAKLSEFKHQPQLPLVVRLWLSYLTCLRFSFLHRSMGIIIINPP